jgi:hypothetical protein
LVAITVAMNKREIDREKRRVTGLRHLWVTKAVFIKKLSDQEKHIRLEKSPLSFYLGPYSHVVKMKKQI